MSPEQACGREVDGRSDLYGLGCSMYHLMTGKLPFPGDSPIERLGKRIGGRHTPITDYLPEMPGSFVRVLDKMLAHKPHERYATAAEAAAALQSLIRPRNRPAAAASAGPASASASTARVAAADSKTPPAQPAPPTIVKVQPAYPRWFAPAARFAEHRPKTALTSVILGLAITFGAGLVLGMLFR
jgi:serine/threonine-protein kinase